MSEDKLTLGEYFRREREEKGLDLKEIEERTKIPAQTLRFLEDDQIDMLPPKVFLRGFLQVISREFDFNEEELLTRLEEVIAVKTASAKPFHDLTYPRGKNLTALITGAVVILILAIIVGITMKQCKDPQEQGSLETYASFSVDEEPRFFNQTTFFL
ncbi:MAG: helix-turn-helix domain-containing protein [Desulfomonilia bacterium]